MTNQHINFTFANFSYSTWRRWHFSMNNATFFDPTGMIPFAKLSYFFFQGPTKCRSISLVCPPTPTSTADERRISLVKQVKRLGTMYFFLILGHAWNEELAQNYNYIFMEVKTPQSYHQYLCRMIRADIVRI